MRTFLIIIGLFLFIGNSFAQSYEELIEKSYDFVDKGDLVSAEESLKAAMRKEPANPLNYSADRGSCKRPSSPTLPH